MKTSAPKKAKISGTRKVTIRDVATRVGVTPMTVSRVFNNTGRISDGTRAAVRQAMEEMGYEPNVNAQRLAGNRDESTIALLLPSLDFDVTLRKVSILQQLLSERGYSVPLHAFGVLAQPNAEEHIRLAHELRRQKPRAIVCKFGALHPGAQDEIRRYQQEGGLVISFNEPADLECDQVLFDREHNNYQSARYLLELGHRAIGIWRTIPDSGNVLASLRLQGFRRALREFGVPERPQWQMHSGHYSDNERSGAELAERLLGMNERPTALCIINDSAAQTCIAGLGRGGVRVPQEMSIVSHDDLPIARYGGLPLTAMSHPIQETAEAIVELLRERIENLSDDPPHRVTLRGELRVRESTAPPQVQREP